MVIHHVATLEVFNVTGGVRHEAPSGVVLEKTPLHHVTLIFHHFKPTSESLNILLGAEAAIINVS